MISTPSPLDHLAAFAIVLVTGIVSTIAIGKYIDYVRRDAHDYQD